MRNAIDYDVFDDLIKLHEKRKGDIKFIPFDSTIADFLRDNADREIKVKHDMKKGLFVISAK